jgi:hypothetical protein
MTRSTYAEELGVCLATIDNYVRAVRGAGKRVTLSTLRAHQRSLRPGPAPDLQRASAIRRMRDRQGMTWAAIGDAWGFSGSRACAIYRGSSCR